MLKYIKNKIFINFLVLLTIFFLDRLTKGYFINLDLDGSETRLFITNYLNFELVWNQGVAFGLFSLNDYNLYNGLSLIITIIVIIILYIAFKSEGLKRFAFLMIAGGAVGNLFDRIFYKKVPDFIDFHIEEFHWFIFNIADIFVTAGVIFMLVIEFIDPKKK